jgi:sodium/hydrogen exchanger-like protein 6/7
LKHYAYFNMSRRTQLVTKFVFQVTSQLAENFIFIYLGLALFSDSSLDFQPPLIIVTIIAVCAARWVAVFPLSKIINWFTMYRASRRGTEIAPPLPYNYQAMLFWAGLRGAVGVALAALLDGSNAYKLRATVLVVVVLTVIIFGGTTARMLDILGIKTGVVEEIDSDDEFDIESFGGGLQAKRSGTGIGYNPRRARTLSLSNLDIQSGSASYVSGHRSPLIKSANPLSRKNSSRDIEHAGLLGRPITADDSDLGSDIDTSDLPPPARRSPMRNSPAPQPAQSDSIFATEGGESSGAGGQNANPITATGAIRQLWAAEDPAGLLRQIDEDYIKPKLLLHGDNNTHNGSSPG